MHLESVLLDRRKERKKSILHRNPNFNNDQCRPYTTQSKTVSDYPITINMHRRMSCRHRFVLMQLMRIADYYNTGRIETAYVTATTLHRNNIGLLNNIIIHTRKFSRFRSNRLRGENLC